MAGGADNGAGIGGGVLTSAPHANCVITRGMLEPDAEGGAGGIGGGDCNGDVGGRLKSAPQANCVMESDAEGGAGAWWHWWSRWQWRWRWPS